MDLFSLFDDGTTATTDASTGAVTSAVDSGGSAIAVASPTGGLTQQFADLVTYGVRAVVDNRLPPAPIPQTGVVASAKPAPAPAPLAISSVLASPTVKLVGLALLGLFLYKRFA